MITEEQEKLAYLQAMLRAWGREQRKREGIPQQTTQTKREGSGMEAIDELSKHLLTAEVTDIAEGRIKTVNLFLSLDREGQTTPLVIQALDALGIDLSNPNTENVSVPEATVTAYLAGEASRPDHIKRVRP